VPVGQVGRDPPRLAAPKVVGPASRAGLPVPLGSAGTYSGGYFFFFAAAAFLAALGVCSWAVR
jgi:hypothetical protein